MMKILLFVIFFVPTFLASAQSIEKRYSSYPTNQGMLYHFSTMKLGKKCNTRIFEYDMTYVHPTDSVTFNYTVTTENPCNVKETMIKLDGKTIASGSTKTLYRDVKKNGYILRTSTKFAITDIEKVFSSTNPPRFESVYDNGVKATATYSVSRWKKEKNLVSRIINSIKL